MVTLDQERKYEGQANRLPIGRLSFTSHSCLRRKVCIDTHNGCASDSLSSPCKWQALACGHSLRRKLLYNLESMKEGYHDRSSNHRGNRRAGTAGGIATAGGRTQRARAQSSSTTDSNQRGASRRGRPGFRKGP